MTTVSAAGSPARSTSPGDLRHIDKHELDPRSLVNIGAGFPISTDPDVAWMADRGRLAHDLWHVLAGYGADEAGESALLAFSLAQTGGRSNALLCIGANIEMVRRQGVRWLADMWFAWRSGRNAVCLEAVPYEDLLDQPLARVRTLLNIQVRAT